MHKVLFVEDEKQVQGLWRAQLANKGVEMIQALNGTDAAMHFLVFSKELAAIVLDGNIPGVKTDTRELIHDFRQSFQGPIIAVSSDENLRALMVEAGADSGCEKKDLAKHLLAVLERSHASA